MDVIERALHGLAILVAEDDYMIAAMMEDELAGAGARVIGPVPSLQFALDMIEGTPRIDAAVLDINMQGETIFPVADALRERGIPFLFSTGYDPSVIPARFKGVVRCEKPVVRGAMTRALTTLVGQSRP